MKVKDILDVICKAEGVTSFKDIPLKRVKEFQDILFVKFKNHNDKKDIL